ncbi:MAG: nucleotidyltransferase family protein [Elusimicrobia bacterium]|nr:nucleotidyltransferase family protein [Elusimicrobiota bacterium]
MADLESLLGRLLREFDRRKTRYALIGGFALGAHGAPRATRDLDFLVHNEDMPGVHEFLTAGGYRRIHHSENVSQYDMGGPWGAIDFIHAFRPLALEMIGRAVSKDSALIGLPVKVVRAEDLIGLKVQSLANNPARRHKELADVESLLEARKDLDWARIREFFVLFGLADAYAELEARFKHGR